VCEEKAHSRVSWSVETLRTKSPAVRGTDRPVSIPARLTFAALWLLLASTGVLLAQTPRDQAWDILHAGMNQKSAGSRTQVLRALRVLPGDFKLRRLS